MKEGTLAMGMREALVIVDTTIPLEMDIVRNSDKGLFNVFTFNSDTHVHGSNVTTARELKKHFTTEMKDVFDQFFEEDEND